jgi:hypothetical protein
MRKRLESVGLAVCRAPRPKALPLVGATGGDGLASTGLEQDPKTPDIQGDLGKGGAISGASTADFAPKPAPEAPAGGDASLDVNELIRKIANLSADDRAKLVAMLAKGDGGKARKA